MPQADTGGHRCTDAAERKCKKLEYVKYLRGKFRQDRKKEKTPREPTQYEVNEMRAEASKRRAVQAREREAARRTDQLVSNFSVSVSWPDPSA